MDNNSIGERIVGETEDISYSKVHDFFEERSRNENYKHKYNYVLYLDDSPEIAVMRDKQGKERVSKLLDIKEGMRVLDIGCGIGRWGELFCKNGLFYVGMDGSQGMIDRAEENLAEFDNKKLFVGELQELDKALADADIQGPFDIIFMSGVLMYLNDDDINRVFSVFPKLAHAGTQLCFIESMSDSERLTLREIYAEELKQNYSAIYRSVSEFLGMMQNGFGNHFELKCNELMDFSDGLQKKREHVTMEHCVIWVAK